MVLSAGRSEDSLPVVLRAGRWLHVQTPFRHQGRSAQRPPGGDLRLLRDRKIATRLKRDGAESLGFCGTGCGRRQHSAPTKKILICFQSYKSEASGRIVCPHSASAQAPPPWNFTLAPRNADRI